MDASRWSDLLSRIVPQDADDLDGLTGPLDRRHGAVGADVFPEIKALLQPQDGFRRADMVAVGLRVTARLTDACDLFDDCAEGFNCAHDRRPSRRCSALLPAAERLPPGK